MTTIHVLTAKQNSREDASSEPCIKLKIGGHGMVTLGISDLSDELNVP